MARAKSASKKSSMTARQKQSQQIMREKERQRRWQSIKSKFSIFFFGSLFIAVIYGGVWVWQTSAVSRGIKAGSDFVYGVTVEAGYRVKNFYLEGRKRTPVATINDVVDVSENTPILRVDIDDVRRKLEEVDSIKSASVERSLPDTLYVRIVEREPVALWQYKGKISLVDDNGVVMSGIDMEPYKDLPLIVGKGAPKNVKTLLEILDTDNKLKKRFTAAVWVGGRRWNIYLRSGSALSEDKGDVEVLLPEKKILDVWKELAELQKKQQILDRDVKVIDLRIRDRLFMKLPSYDTTGKNNNSKEI
ncbi:MAG: FtsQ-type POTRA domain-containing protein [Rickettsiales bacterium]